MKKKRTTWAQIMAERHEQARQRQRELQKFSREVTVKLSNERSKFMRDFDEAEQRIFQCKA